MASHLLPYPFEWLHDDVEMQIHQQSKIRIRTKEFIDEVTYKVVLLDLCQVILGSPYLWDQDAIYFRQAQRYHSKRMEGSSSSLKI